MARKRKTAAQKTEEKAAKEQQTPDENPANLQRQLAQLLLEVHTLAGLKGIGQDVLYRHIDANTPATEGAETLYERLQVHGLLMYDGETTIKVNATRMARIEGSPLWKKNLLYEYERDTDGTGVVARWVAFIYPPVEGVDPDVGKSEDPPNDEPDNADDPDHGTPPEA